MDSHCECTTGWLEPLLDRIARDSTTVVCPVIDVIDDTTLEYHFHDSGGVNVGGFDWNLQFNWHAVPEHEKKRHKNPAEPVWSPTMAGGLFSIDRVSQFFFYLSFKHLTFIYQHLCCPRCCLYSNHNLYTTENKQVELVSIATIVLFTTYFQ